MTTGVSSRYTQIPTTNPEQGRQSVVVLQPYHDYHYHRGNLRRCLALLAVFVILSTAIFALYPYDPDIRLSRLHLNNFHLHTTPKISLSLSLSLTLRVHNPNFFSLNYTSLNVSIGYRGRELGFVRSNGGLLKAKRVSYVAAVLDLDAVEVAHDVIYLIGDLAKGLIAFDTVSVVEGSLGLFFFQVPLEGEVSCEVYIDTDNQTISHQDCYPELCYEKSEIAGLRYQNSLDEITSLKQFTLLGL
ncbi:Late embryogenesis abundant protein, LEA_2 subgroup [Dillenia turbinata]|uniref:Late embryogenesis abundant protein, LEA_2 subgroup n=1 Tax=Dillenia turbinata TaxID=194707 RepID=A0AAN8W899_9MAGN